MSHEATNWAIKQRGLKPSAKVVLWHLCDRYHPDQGCFPSLDTLADDCELSRRAVQDQIDILVKAGLVTVEKMPRKRGQMPRNRYRFAFENDHSALGQNLPMAKSAYGKKERSPLANSDNRLGQNLPTNPVRVTSKETSKAAQDPEGSSDRILNLRAGLIQAMGLTGSELNTSGTFVVRSMSPAELQLSLDVWSKNGLTDQQIIAAVSAKMQAERERNGSFLPKSVRFFDGAISDHAQRLNRPAGKAASTTSSVQTETREQRSKRRARLIGG